MAAGSTSAVIFDQFCARCDLFLNPEEGQDPAYSAPWPHSRLGNIQSTALSGCHLCSILVRCIGAVYRDEAAETSISLFVKENDIIRIRVGTDQLRHTPLLRFRPLKIDDLDLVFNFRRSISTIDFRSRIHEQILEWKRECQDRHENCSHRAGSRLPTRLLHLSGDCVRLVDAEGVLAADTKYVTLSHRWPRTPSLKLEKRTMTRFREGVPLVQIPPLFGDVCQLALTLGCSYTWIDALCIIQDDENDWTRESALMINIYANSQLTIVAGRSQQHESLYSVANSLMLSPAIIKGSRLAKIFGTDAIFNFDTEETAQIARLPSDHRAWILQECEISPRMVYFGDVETIWECTSKLQCDSSQPGGISCFDSDSSNEPRNIRAQIARFRHDYIGLTEARCSFIWSGLVSKYTSLDISFESDRLVAISGLSQYLQKEAPGQFGEYHAGLWEVGFERQLLWHCMLNMPGVVSSTSYLAPSWSWASHTSRVQYRSSPGASSVVSLIENLAVSVVPRSSNASHGQVKDGYFSCLANICPMYLSCEQVVLEWTWAWSVQLTPSTTRFRIDIDIYLDRPNEISAAPGSQNAFRDFYLLPLLCYDFDDHGNAYRRRPWCSRLFTDWQCCEDTSANNSLPKGRWGSPLASDEGYWLAGLVLYPIPQRQGCYTRAGIAIFSSPDTIFLLQDACRSSVLPSEMFMIGMPDRHAYEIRVY